MSIVFPDNRASAPLSRRSVLLGLAASSLPAPAIVRKSSIMPVRRVLLTDTSRPSAGFVQRLFYNSLAVGLRRGQTTFRFSANALTLSEAESIVRYARRNGWIDERYVAFVTSGSRSNSGEDQSKQ
ncbi:hypothetical protein [Bradyrhizobium sp. ARR65]|uniref:hypothetical protein n=1 Tax=Bradyrhizobium sp. ARR65 TaxID=1040989 RepID=UPI000ACC71E9|nr:hypothetical protein [Bradyrhizobium sp. ARR65]